jgi:hypothetical protein
MMSQRWSLKNSLLTRVGRSSQGGFTLVLALVVLSVMFAAAAGLSLARQFWGFSASKHLDRVLMEASVAADMSLWFSVFRAQVQDSALVGASSYPNVDFGVASTQQQAATSMASKGLVWPSKAVSVVYPITANATAPLFVPPDASKYPEFASGVSTWHFDRLFRLEPRATWLPDSKQDLKGTVPYPMGAKDPYFGSYSRIHGMPLLFRREMEDKVYKERMGRFVEGETKLRAWYSIDGAGNLGAGIRSLPISQFTLFSTQPYGAAQGEGAKDPLILSFYRLPADGVPADPNPALLTPNGWEPAALFLDKNVSYSYDYQDPERAGVAYPSSRVGIGRVYVEGYAKIVGGVIPSTAVEQPLPLGIPLVVTGEGPITGGTTVRGYGGLFGSNGSTLSGKPAAFTSYYGGSTGTTFSFLNFSEYLQFGGLQGGFMVSSSHVTPSRLLRTFAEKDPSGSVWRNKPLESFVEEWGGTFGGVRDRLSLVGNGTSLSPFQLSVTTSSNATVLAQAWTFNGTEKRLTFKPASGYLDSGWGVNEPPLVVYLDKSWKTHNFTIVLDVPDVSELGPLTNDAAIPREGRDRLTVLSVQDVHLKGNFNGNGTDSGTMVVAPRIFVDPDVEKVSGIFVTEAPSPMGAFWTEGTGPAQSLFQLRGGLVLWNRTEALPPSWQAGTFYVAGQTVQRSSVFYKAKETHTSASSFNPDSSKWDEVVRKPVCLVPDVDYISGKKMPYGGWASVDLVPRWVGPPVVMDARAYTETLELYKIRAARKADATGYRGYKEENRND